MLCVCARVFFLAGPPVCCVFVFSRVSVYIYRRGFCWNDVIVNERLPAVLLLVVVGVVGAAAVIRTARSSNHVKRIRSLGAATAAQTESR